MIKKMIIIIMVLLLLIAAMLLAIVRRETPKVVETQMTEEDNKISMENSDAKEFKDYTWEEYCALTAEEQFRFYNSFEPGEFDAWLEKNEPVTAVVAPWDADGAKQPDTYTWEEYNNLTNDQQVLFFNWFENEVAFENWRSGQTNEETVKAPWEQPGAKQPGDYTWDEYLALSVQNQSAFYNSFGGETAFNEWLEQAKPAEATEAVQEAVEFVLKDEYTWEEYMALTEQEKTAYYNTFESEAAFNAWLDSVQPAAAGTYPWEQPGSKNAEEYTWAEYDSLSPDQQTMFYNYLNSQGKFDAWLAVNEPE